MKQRTAPFNISFNFIHRLISWGNKNHSEHIWLSTQISTPYQLSSSFLSTPNMLHRIEWTFHRILTIATNMSHKPSCTFILFKLYNAYITHHGLKTLLTKERPLVFHKDFLRKYESLNCRMNHHFLNFICIVVVL